MKTYRIPKMVLALAAAITLVFSGQFAAAVEEKSEKTPIDVFKVRVPEVYGTIKEVHKGGDKVVFYLQDAHCNLEAQQNNARILQDLMSQYGLDTVCVEGTAGPIDVSHLSSLPDKEALNDAVSYFMSHGKITGPEYLAITGDKPFALIGIEDAQLKKQNDDLFKQNVATQKATAEQVAALKSALSPMAEKVFSPDAKAFVGACADYRDGKIKFTEYAQTLRDAAGKSAVDTSGFKNFTLQGKSFDMEGKIDFDAVEDERAGIVDDLSKKLAKEDTSNLVVQSLSFRLGRMGAVEYYDLLKGYCDKAGVALKDKANLAQYIDYIKVFEDINKDALVDEAAAIEDAVKAKLLASDEERNLDRVMRHVDMIGKMNEIKLGIRDYKVFNKNASDMTPTFIVDFVKVNAEKHGIAVPSADAVSLQGNVDAISKFYSVACDRDDILAKNAMATMKDKNLDRMALVTGGFHTSAITEKLGKEGFSVVVITPRITDFNVKSPYVDVMLDKPTPLEEVYSGETVKVETDAPKTKTEPGSPTSKGITGTQPKGPKEPGEPGEGTAKTIGDKVAPEVSDRVNARVADSANHATVDLNDANPHNAALRAAAAAGLRVVVVRDEASDVDGAFDLSTPATATEPATTAVAHGFIAEDAAGVKYFAITEKAYKSVHPTVLRNTRAAIVHDTAEHSAKVANGFYDETAPDPKRAKGQAAHYRGLNAETAAVGPARILEGVDAVAARGNLDLINKFVADTADKAAEADRIAAVVLKAGAAMDNADVSFAKGLAVGVAERSKMNLEVAKWVAAVNARPGTALKINREKGVIEGPETAIPIPDYIKDRIQNADVPALTISPNEQSGRVEHTAVTKALTQLIQRQRVVQKDGISVLMASAEAPLATAKSGEEAIVIPAQLIRNFAVDATGNLIADSGSATGVFTYAVVDALRKSGRQVIITSPLDPDATRAELTKEGFADFSGIDVIKAANAEQADTWLKAQTKQAKVTRWLVQDGDEASANHLETTKQIYLVVPQGVSLGQAVFELSSISPDTGRIVLDPATLEKLRAKGVSNTAIGQLQAIASGSVAPVIEETRSALIMLEDNAQAQETAA